MCFCCDSAIKHQCYFRRNAFTQNLSSPDLKQFLSLLLCCGVFADALPNKENVTPPRIHSRSEHYRFALYLLAGYPYEEACERLRINPRTEERWRTDLRRTASQYFGRPVTYEFAARYALDSTFRHACETALRESPQPMPENPCPVK